MDALRKQNNELANRLQAGDLQSFVALQHQTKSTAQGFLTTDFVPRNDAGELSQLKSLYAQHGIEATGLGDSIYDEDNLMDIQEELNWLLDRSE